MSPTTVAVLGIVFLVVLFMLQMPVAYSMALAGFLGFIYVVSVKGGLTIVAMDFWVQFSSYSLTVIPLFIFMGVIASYSGASRRLYDTAYKFVGQVQGGLALATILACAGFGAMCGSTNAAAAAMGKVTLPEMRRFHYDDSLATACVAAGGSLAVLIPPSTIFMIYGILTEQSIGKLFVAGVLPGLLLTALFAVAITIRVRSKPGIAPAGPRTTWKEKIASLPGAIEMLGLFGLVTGGLILGWFTPTEAGAVGAAGALVVGLVRRGITWRGFTDCLADTTRITAMVFLIVTGATLFGHFMSVTRLPFELAGWVGGLDLPPNAIMGLIVFGYLIAGCFLDSLAMVTLTIPILYPLILSLGFNPIWFGVIIVLVVEMGVITPPVGINVYVIKGVAPDVPMATIFRGIGPFLVSELVCIGILLAFPQIALFLPSFMTW
jgi:C4-dicarboxylate transporter DctM subunit